MRTPSFKLLFGIGCFLWIAIKAYDLYDPAVEMSKTKTVFTYVGIVAFAILGVSSLTDYWNMQKIKKTK